LGDFVYHFSYDRSALLALFELFLEVAFFNPIIPMMAFAPSLIRVFPKVCMFHQMKKGQLKIDRLQKPQKDILEKRINTGLYLKIVPVL